MISNTQLKSDYIYQEGMTQWFMYIHGRQNIGERKRAYGDLVDCTSEYLTNHISILD